MQPQDFSNTPPETQRDINPLAAIALRIRQSLNLEEILNRTVEEVRNFLNCDRVIIYGFNPDWSGTINIESVSPNCSPILGITIQDHCFKDNWVEAYRQGRVSAIENIHTSQLQQCHIDLLQRFEVIANLVLPILQTIRLENSQSLPSPKLWGLLIAHQCDKPRNWEVSEINFLQQLATQVAIAIQQAELYQQLEKELVERRNAQAEMQNLNEQLELRVEQRTAQLQEVNKKLRLEIARRKEVEKGMLESQVCLRLINNISNSRTAGLSGEEIITATLAQIHKFFPKLRVTYFSIDENNKLTGRQCFHPPEMESLTNRVIDLSFLPKYLQELNSGEIIIVENINNYTDLRPILQDLSLLKSEAFIATPLRISNNLVGVLTVGYSQPRQWSEYEIATFIEIGEYLSATLQEAYAEQEREKAEKALLESERKFKAIFDQAFQFVGLLSPDGTVLEANQTALDFIGLQRQDIINRPFWEIYSWQISENTKQRLQESIIKAAAGEFIRYEVEIMGEGNRVVTIDFSLRPIKDETGKVVLIIPEGRDITALKQAQQERDRFFNNSMDLMAIADLNGNLTLTNFAWETSLGYSKNQIENINFKELLHPEDVEKTNQAWQRGIATGLPLIAIENRHRCQDGSYRWFSWNYVFFPKEGLVYKFGRDISARKKAENALQKLNEELETRIQRRTQELRDTNEKLLAEITERQRIELQLAQSEDRYRAVSELISDYAYALQIDTNGAIVFEWVAGRFSKDFDIQQQEAPGLVWQEIVHPEDRALLQQRQEKWFLDQTDISEYRVRDKNSATRWLLDYSRPVNLDLNRGFVRVYGAAQDITERKTAEAALRQSEERLKALINGAPIILWSVDSQGIFTLSEGKAIELLGIKAGEIVGQSIFDVYRDLPEILEATRKAMAGETNFRIIQDQGLFWESWYTPFRDNQGEVVGVIGVSTDVTEREKAELALRESNERFRKIFQEGLVGIAFVSLNYKFLKVNGMLCKMLGYTQEELTQLTFVDITHPEDLEIDLQLAQQLFKNEIPYYQIEKRYLNKNGEVFWAYLNASVVRNENGHPLYGLAMISDINERKKAEERIQNSLQEKEILLKEIHHRVKNNLQVISSLLSLQSRLISDPEALQMFADSQNRILSIALIHEQLYQSPDLAKINLQQYIQQLTQQLFSSYGSRADRVKLSLNVEPVSINIETAMPCGLLINELVSNSLKYAFPNQGDALISIDFYSLDQEKFSLSVADNGVGIPPEINLKTTKSLGLRLVSNLTRQLKAELNIERENGTRFSFTFGQLQYRGRF